MKIILLFLVTNIFAQQYNTAKVIGIKDGDTIVVLDSVNTQITLRLAEVDCPEKNQPFGTKSKQFTSDQVYKKTINYVVTDTDRYGRFIAKVFYDNKYLSEEIIKNGMGWHYKKYSTSKKLSDLEIIARKNKIGLWVEHNPIEPHNWRKL